MDIEKIYNEYLFITACLSQALKEGFSSFDPELEHEYAIYIEANPPEPPKRTAAVHAPLPAPPVSPGAFEIASKLLEDEDVRFSFISGTFACCFYNDYSHNQKNKHNAKMRKMLKAYGTLARDVDTSDLDGFLSDGSINALIELGRIIMDRYIILDGDDIVLPLGDEEAHAMSLRVKAERAAVPEQSEKQSEARTSKKPRKRGRPRKEETAKSPIEEKPKHKRGRPPKKAAEKTTGD